VIDANAVLEVDTVSVDDACIDEDGLPVLVSVVRADGDDLTVSACEKLSATLRPEERLQTCVADTNAVFDAWLAVAKEAEASGERDELPLGDCDAEADGDCVSDGLCVDKRPDGDALIETERLPVSHADDVGEDCSDREAPALEDALPGEAETVVDIETRGVTESLPTVAVIETVKTFERLATTLKLARAERLEVLEIKLVRDSEAVWLGLPDVLVDTEGLEERDVVALPLGDSLCDVDTDVDAVIEEDAEAVSTIDVEPTGVTVTAGDGDNIIDGLESGDAEWALLRDAR
jgi:ferredoxin